MNVGRLFDGPGQGFGAENGINLVTMLVRYQILIGRRAEIYDALLHGNPANPAISVPDRQSYTRLLLSRNRHPPVALVLKCLVVPQPPLERDPTPHRALQGSRSRC
jgi:hypothetical protein